MFATTGVLVEADVDMNGFPELTSTNDEIFVEIRILSLGISIELHDYLAICL